MLCRRRQRGIFNATQKAKVRNWGSDSAVARRRRTWSRMNRITAGTVSRISRAHCSWLTTINNCNLQQLLILKNTPSASLVKAAGSVPDLPAALLALIGQSPLQAHLWTNHIGAQVLLQPCLIVDHSLSALIVILVFLILIVVIWGPNSLLSLLHGY